MAPAVRASTRATSSRRSASQPMTDHQFPSPESAETSLRPPSSTSDILLQALSNQISALDRSTENQFASLTESVKRVVNDNTELWKSIQTLQNRPQVSSSSSSHFPKPARFSGEELSIFRGWWTSVTAYLDANADSLATDKIKISWVGSFLTGKAQVWHLARSGEYSPLNGPDNHPRDPDTWTSYSRDLIERFTDISLNDKNHKKMEALVYQGDIHDFLTQFEELNTSGHGLGFFERRLIYQAIPQRIIDLLFARHLEEPKSDHDFIKALKEAGTAYNRIPSVGTGVSTSTSRPKPRVPTSKTDTKSFPKPGGPKVWASTKEALVGIDQSAIDKRKNDGKNCWRCGRDEHYTLSCFANLDLEDRPLPPAPFRLSGSTPRVAALKRFPDDEDSTTPPEKTLRLAEDLTSYYEERESDSDF
ncbi:hypothetical protein E4U17_000843 [Claviceps sp. LM77 group G4]|nr:hypothetical protein E4U17_000843 [Claviceps sp. LM77 group G4]KAG6059679.1 hypothetical protein E4U33_007080 [Claviceps sp. LM78 group G4]